MIKEYEESDKPDETTENIKEMYFHDFIEYFQYFKIKFNPNLDGIYAEYSLEEVDIEDDTLYSNFTFTSEKQWYEYYFSSDIRHVIRGGLIIGKEKVKNTHIPASIERTI